MPHSDGWGSVVRVKRTAKEKGRGEVGGWGVLGASDMVSDNMLQ
jgi:hypothetical protein